MVRQVSFLFSARPLDGLLAEELGLVVCSVVYVVDKDQWQYQG